MPTRIRLLLVALAALVLAAGCQLDVALDVEVASDGSGLVTVGIGLDAAGLARAGNLDQQLRVDDLKAAGWTVSGPTPEGATTWVRASKPFADPAQANQVIAEVAGPDGPFQGFAVAVDDGLGGTTYRVTGTIDLADGPAMFSDPALAAALEGDPFGGTLDAIVQQEGRSVADMVDVQVGVRLPGMSEPQVVTAGFADATPVAVDVSSTQGGLLRWWVVAAVLALALVTTVVLRRAAVVRRRQRGRFYR